MSLAHDLQAIAIDIAREAGDLARARRDVGVAIAATKSALADIVTEADREVEALIRARLKEIRPDDGFLGEETGAETGASGITWVVDPIDGTVNYAYGIPTYAISIAAVSGDPAPEHWEALAGVVHNPVTGEMFHAAKNGGAWLGDVRLAVNPDVGGAGALIGTGFGYDPSTHAGDLALVERVMPIARDLRRAGAASLDLASVAAGRLDAYYERGLQPWDLAAGSLLVTEAGGRFARAKPDGSRRAPLVVAASPAVFDELAAITGLV